MTAILIHGCSGDDKPLENPSLDRAQTVSHPSLHKSFLTYLSLTQWRQQQQLATTLSLYLELSPGWMYYTNGSRWPSRQRFAAFSRSLRKISKWQVKLGGKKGPFPPNFVHSANCLEVAGWGAFKLSISLCASMHILASLLVRLRTSLSRLSGGWFGLLGEEQARQQPSFAQCEVGALFHWPSERAVDPCWSECWWSSCCWHCCPHSPPLPLLKGDSNSLELGSEWAWYS